MKNSNRVVMLAMALGGLSFNGWTEESHDPDMSKDTPEPVNAQAQPAQDAPAKINKASSLLGLTVENPSHEKLGKIQDLVLDLKSAKISYVVIATGEKQVAVPPVAFSANAERTGLMLTTTPARIEAAKGLASGSWPSPINPDLSTGRFWEGGNLAGGVEPSPIQSDTMPGMKHEMATLHREPAKVDMASTLLGMAVTDAEGNKLGTITDIVVNLKSGKAAYAVITTDVVGSVNNEEPTSKMVAAPLYACRANQAMDGIVLQTTKEKLAMAAGLTRDRWPSVDNTVWGAENSWTQPEGKSETHDEQAEPKDTHDEKAEPKD